MKSHTGDEPYQCKKCDKDVSTSSNLLHHMRTHSGWKLYKCSHYDKAFSDITNLECHLRRHTVGRGHINETNVTMPSHILFNL